MNQPKEANNFTKAWQTLSAWLHTADLVPVVIIISTYHYFGALRAHDPIWVAFPIALFVDLLHYRSISRAVVSGRFWWIAALLTTGLAFSLQFYFYSGGQPALTFWPFVYASLVPIGLAIMAMLDHARKSEKVTNWIEELANMRSALAAAQEEARQATAAAEVATKMKQNATAATELATAMKQEATKALNKATKMKQEATEALQKATEIKQEATAARQEATEALQKATAEEEIAKLGKHAALYWPHLNQKTTAGLLYLAKHYPNLATAAAEAEVHKSTLSKHVALLNHNQKEG